MIEFLSSWAQGIIEMCIRDRFNASEFLLKVVEALVTNGLVCSPSEKL